MKISQEQIKMVTSAVMAGMIELKPEKGTEPINYWHFSKQMAEMLDNIDADELNEIFSCGNDDCCLHGQDE